MNEDEKITIESLKELGFEESRSLKVNRVWSWRRMSFQATVSTLSDHIAEYRKGLISFTVNKSTGAPVRVMFGEEFVTTAEHFTNGMVMKLWYGLYGKEIHEYVSS